MKILKPAPAKKKESGRVFDGSWTATRERFLELKPLDLTATPDSVLVVPENQRVYIAKTAKENGISYFSFAIPGTDTRLFVRTVPLDKAVKKAKAKGRLD